MKLVFEDQESGLFYHLGCAFSAVGGKMRLVDADKVVEPIQCSWCEGRIKGEGAEEESR